MEIIVNIHMGIYLKYLYNMCFILLYCNIDSFCKLKILRWVLSQDRLQTINTNDLINLISGHYYLVKYTNNLYINAQITIKNDQYIAYYKTESMEEYFHVNKEDIFLLKPPSVPFDKNLEAFFVLLLYYQYFH